MTTQRPSGTRRVGRRQAASKTVVALLFLVIGLGLLASAGFAYYSPFPAGAAVPVAINPADASDLRHEPGASLLNLVVPAVLGALGLMCMIVGLFTIRPRPTPSPTPPPAWNAPALRRVAVSFTIIGSVLLGIGIWLFARDAAMLREWPMVDGEVTDVALVTRTSRSKSGLSDRLYDVQVTFTYESGGKRYEGETATGIASTSRDRAAALLKQYARGTHHPIRHRPDDPHEIRFAVNRLSIFATAGGLTLMGLVFLAFGLGFLKARNQGPAE